MNNREKFSGTKKVLVFIFACILLILCCLVFCASGAEGAVVRKVEIQGLYSIGEEELLYLMDIRPGDVINAESVRQGIKRTFLKGIFEDISVETTDGDNTDVFIHVRERDFIQKISIKGDYDLPQKTIAELFFLKEEQTLTCDMLNKAMKELTPQLATLGFPQGRISAEVERLKEPYRINIRLKVNTGIPKRIKKIVISGAGDEIRKVMTLSEGNVFNEIIMKKDIEKIKAYYKSKQYYKPVITPPVFSDGTLTIFINPGKRLLINFGGNKGLSTKALLKEMPFFEAEEFNDDIVQESIQRLLAVYHMNGYVLAQVDPVITSNAETIDLKFVVYEGPRVKTEKLSFVGNSLNDKRLKEIMSMKEGEIYNPDLIETDRRTLQDFYIALGYLSVTIDEFQSQYREDTHKTNITVTIKEGMKTEIEKIIVSGIKLASEKEIRELINLKPGDAYNEVDIYEARLRVIEFYSNKGFPGVSVSVKSDFTGQKATVTFQINEGEIALFGKIIFAGHHKTKYSVMKRELLQQENTPFDYSLLAQERQKLYKLGLFTDVDMEVIDRHEEKKDILMKLHEGNAGAVEFGLGYADYEKYRGFLDLSYRNLWGMNRQASIRLELSSLEKRLILQYYEPWILNRPLPLRIFLLSESKTELNFDTKDTLYKLTRQTATAGIEKKIGEHVKSELYYEFSVVNTYHVQPDVILSKEDTGSLIISGLRLGLVYDTRDNPFYPAKGILSGITVKVTAPVFFSETDFIKCTAYYNIYYEIIKGVVLAASLRGGVAQGYLKTDVLPLVERFFLGGRTTVRGYGQDELGPKGSDGNPVGGNTFLMENIEARIPLSKSMGFVTFLDGGNVWQKIDAIDPKDIKFTTGLGLRYNTPVGPLRVDYGYKLQREKGESAGELHFSIGHAF